MPPATAKKSAKAIIKASLAQFGLESLADWVWQRYLTSGASSPQEALMMMMPDLRQTPEYKARFPAMDSLSEKGHAMSEAEYIGYEKSVAGVMRVAGLPEQFYDSPDDYAALLGAELSPAEVQDRVLNGYAQVANAPPAVREAFAEFFGAAGDNNLAMYFIDPEKAAPVLAQQVRAAQVSGIGRRYGIGANVDLSMALAQQGVTQEGAETAFGNLSKSEGLFDENVGEEDDLQVDVEGVEAAFGLDPLSRVAVERRSQSRQASFAGSGGAAATREGAVGLGSAGKP